MLDPGTWNGRQTIYMPHKCLGVPGRIGARLGLVDLGGIGHALPGLRHGRQAVHLRNNLHCQPRAHRRQTVVQVARGVGRGDIRALAQQDWPGIQPCLHLHDADTCAVVARHNRAVDRSCPAPSRQQGCMDIDATLCRGVEDVLRQDQTVCHDHGDIGLKGCELRLRGFVFKRFRSADFEAQRLGPRLHWRWTVFLAPTCRTRRLRIDCGDLMSRLHQSVQYRHRKIGRPHEDHAHFDAFRKSMSRLSFDRR